MLASFLLEQEAHEVMFVHYDFMICIRLFMFVCKQILCGIILMLLSLFYDGAWFAQLCLIMLPWARVWCCIRRQADAKGPKMRPPTEVTIGGGGGVGTRFDPPAHSGFP